jgi:hypothetical protein
VLGKPKAATLTVPDVAVKPGVTVTELGVSNALVAKTESGNTQIMLPAQLMGEYAYSFKLAGYLH